MKKLECKAFAYRLQGLTITRIQKRLIREGADEAEAINAIQRLQGINENALRSVMTSGFGGRTTGSVTNGTRLTKPNSPIGNA